MVRSLERAGANAAGATVTAAVGLEDGAKLVARPRAYTIKTT